MCELVQRKTGPNDNDDTHGNINADRYVKYISECGVPYLGKVNLLEPRSVVVMAMDNCPIHNDPRVRARIEGAGARLIYTAPYSPDLNPIEFCFHQYKAFLRRHYRRGAHFGYIHGIIALRCVSYHDMCGYYKHVGIRNTPARSRPKTWRRCSPLQWWKWLPKTRVRFNKRIRRLL
jgi:hypothetical protein